MKDTCAWFFPEAFSQSSSGTKMYLKSRRNPWKIPVKDFVFIKVSGYKQRVKSAIIAYILSLEYIPCINFYCWLFIIFLIAIIFSRTALAEITFEIASVIVIPITSMFILGWERKNLFQFSLQSLHDKHDWKSKMKALNIL